MSEKLKTKIDIWVALPEEMRDVFDELIAELESELEEVKRDRDSYQEEAQAAVEKTESEAFNVLRAVRDWFDNVILLGRPMTDPRAVWKQVERALE